MSSLVRKKLVARQRPVCKDVSVSLSDCVNVARGRKRTADGAELSDCRDSMDSPCAKMTSSRKSSNNQTPSTPETRLLSKTIAVSKPSTSKATTSIGQFETRLYSPAFQSILKSQSDQHHKQRRRAPPPHDYVACDDIGASKRLSGDGQLSNAEIGAVESSCHSDNESLDWMTGSAGSSPHATSQVASNIESTAGSSSHPTNVPGHPTIKIERDVSDDGHVPKVDPQTDRSLIAIDDSNNDAEPEDAGSLCEATFQLIIEVKKIQEQIVSESSGLDRLQIIAHKAVRSAQDASEKFLESVSRVSTLTEQAFVATNSAVVNAEQHLKSTRDYETAHNETVDGLRRQVADMEENHKLEMARVLEQLKEQEKKQITAERASKEDRETLEKAKSNWDNETEQRLEDLRNRYQLDTELNMLAWKRTADLEKSQIRAEGERKLKVLKAEFEQKSPIRTEEVKVRQSDQEKIKELTTELEKWKDCRAKSDSTNDDESTGDGVTETIEDGRQGEKGKTGAAGSCSETNADESTCGAGIGELETLREGEKGMTSAAGSCSETNADESPDGLVIGVGETIEEGEKGMTGPAGSCHVASKEAEQQVR